MPEIPASGEEIYAHLRRQIVDGKLTGRIPTREALAAEHGVSVWTIGDVVKRLKAEGMLVTRGGNGTWVAPRQE